jgi:hypothetical protein
MIGVEVPERVIAGDAVHEDHRLAAAGVVMQGNRGAIGRDDEAIRRERTRFRRGRGRTREEQQGEHSPALTG